MQLRFSIVAIAVVMTLSSMKHGIACPVESGPASEVAPQVQTRSQKPALVLEQDESLPLSVRELAATAPWRDASSVTEEHDVLPSLLSERSFALDDESVSSYVREVVQTAPSLDMEFVEAHVRLPSSAAMVGLVEAAPTLLNHEDDLAISTNEDQEVATTGSLRKFALPGIGALDGYEDR